MRNYGLVPSVMDGTEFEYSAPMPITIPEKYSYVNFLPKVIDQGYNPICVPCSISAYVNWKENLKHGDNKKDNKVMLFDIYASRTTPGNNGMSFKDALKFMRHTGVDTNAGKSKIDRYAKIGSVDQLKNAILSNGPCIGGLPVYNSDKDFWNQKGGDYYRGGHAISIVGFDKDGFIIRNSWGDTYANNGYTKLKYSDFPAFMEIWTMF